MASPYVVAARDYFEAGWSPVPLPYKEKSPVPDGYTGALGKYVDEETLKGWLKPKTRLKAGNFNFPPGNIALRLPKGVLGIDVDAYGEKTGAETLAAAEEVWGALPLTWVTTSKDDGVSGIRLFRIPEDLAWPGELPQGKGVELLRWDHRFAIVAPSVHDKTGATYKWFREQELVNPHDGDGNPDAADVDVQMVEMPDEFPAPEDLPALPQEWIDGLTRGKKWKERSADEELDASALQSWLAERVNPDEMCAAMRKTVTTYSRQVRTSGVDGGAHDDGRDGIWAILGDSKSGHSGVVAALAELRQVFFVAVRKRRGSVRQAQGEWARALSLGAAKISAEGGLQDADPCVSLSAGSGGSSALTFQRDDIGNAARLIAVMDDRARWVEAWNSWVLWDAKTGVWKRDANRQTERWAVKAVNEIAAEAEFLEKEEDRKALRAWAKASGNTARLDAMVKVARARAGLIVAAEDFDANPTLLGVGNGVVVLNGSGVTFRPSVREDLLTLATPVKYVEGSTSAAWEAFLKHAQPDVEVRTWLQRLAGYSLMGGNPASLLVALVGVTFAGKTMFAEALSRTLGPYAGPMPASVLRDNPDDKPRPDLIDALPRRLIIAEELSEAQHLHTDQIKRLTGGSVIAARGHRSNYIYRKPAFTPWIATNSPPTVNGADAALWRRLVVVPFNHPFPASVRDPEYAAKLAANEAESILAWLIEGYRLYREGGSISEIPVGALEANARFRDDLSELDSFIAEACIQDHDISVAPRKLYEAYKTWCEIGGVRGRDVLSERKFGLELTGKGYHKRQIWEDSKGRWVRLGIALNEAFGRVS